MSKKAKECNEVIFRKSGSGVHLRYFKCRSNVFGDCSLRPREYINMWLRSRAEASRRTDSRRMEMGRVQRRRQLRYATRPKIPRRPRTRRRRQEPHEPAQQQSWPEGECKSVIIVQSAGTTRYALTAFLLSRQGL